MRFHAIPVAISVLEHRLPHDYTSRTTIAHRFQDGSRPLQDLIDEARAAKISVDDPVYFWVSDDKGMADFTIAAFAIFGFNEQSLFFFYFAVLGLTSAVFAMAHRREPQRLALLALILTSMWVFLNVLPLSNEASFFSIGINAPLSTHVAIFESRILELLAFIPVIHISLFSFRHGRLPSIEQTLYAAIQGIVFYFCYHSRSSLGWMLVALLLVVGFSAYQSIRQNDQRNYLQKLGSSATVTVILVALGFCLAVYKHLTYHPRYFQDKGTRTIWHNSLMGMSYDKGLASTYMLGLSDRDIAEAVISYGKSIKGDELPRDWSAETILYSLGSHNDFDWPAYERVARGLYFHIWRNHFLRTLRLYLIKKPIRLADIIAHATLPSLGRRDVEMVRKKYSLYFRPLTPKALLFAALPLILLFGYFLKSKEEPIIVTIILITSLIPSIVFYPAIMTLAGTFLAISLLIYLLLPRALSCVWKRYFLA
jgi:hypothetical protein